MLVERHGGDVTHAERLALYRSEILHEVDRMALRVGALLRQARAEMPEQFVGWVTNDLPFGLDTAKRMMAISEAYEKLDRAVLDQLPRPWQALYALRALPADELQRAIEAGQITNDMTTAEAQAVARLYRTGGSGALSSRSRHHRADIAAGALMEFTPNDMNPHVLRALRRWLSGAES